MQLQLVYRLFRLIRHFRLLDKSGPESYHLVIIDGPASIAISKLIVQSNTSLNFRFLASAHFLARLDASDTRLGEYVVGWRLSTIIQATFRSLFCCKGIRRMPYSSNLAALVNSECVVREIQRGASHIKTVVVFNERSPFTKLAVTTAKSHNIATACIQHGAVVRNYFPVTVDRYFTWSEFYSGLLKKEAPHLRTFSVGRLGYTIPHDIPKADKRNSPLLVLQPADVSIARDELLSHFKKIIDVCYNHFDSITLRPHPNDNITLDIATHIGNRLFSIDSGCIRDALGRHTVTISLYSTVLLEAPIYGSLPVQYLESSYSEEIMRRCELHAESPQALEVILNNLKDKSYLTVCLTSAKKYAEQRMHSGDISAFFKALHTT